MIVFKTFLKVLNKNKWIVLMYTIILIAFGGLNLKTSDTSLNFVANKPDILIINNDISEGITKNLIDYISNNSNIIEIENDENKINDALFYRDVNYIIYIPKNFKEDFLNGKNPSIEVKSTKDYQASLAQMLLEKYLKIANIYLSSGMNEEEIIQNINNTLSQEVNVEITSKIQIDNLSQATFYYNFASYSLLAGCVYVISIILSSFKEENISKRTIISSMPYKLYNRYLFLSNALFAFLLWLFYVLLSFIILGKGMFSMHGLIYLLNSFIFVICSLSIAFLIANIIKNKNAINGIVNVLALGSSFLCGAFVPMEWLPPSVLKIAHILPSYWYIKTNELLTNIEVFNFTNMKPILGNLLVILLFTLLFVLITNILTKYKRKIG